MLQEERQAAREQQAHLRSKDEELRILLEKKDEDLRKRPKRYSYLKLPKGGARARKARHKRHIK